MTTAPTGSGFNQIGSGIGIVTGFVQQLSAIPDILASIEAAKFAAAQARRIIALGFEQGGRVAEEGQQFAAKQLTMYHGIDVTRGSPNREYVNNMYNSALNAATVANEYFDQAMDIIARGKATRDAYRGRAIGRSIQGTLTMANYVPWGELDTKPTGTQTTLSLNRDMPQAAGDAGIFEQRMTPVPKGWGD